MFMFWLIFIPSYLILFALSVYLFRKYIKGLHPRYRDNEPYLLYLFLTLIPVVNVFFALVHAWDDLGWSDSRWLHRLFGHKGA